MSMEGAGQCGICGAWSDYCTLRTASGIDVDCRELKLRHPSDLQYNIELAKNLREAMSEDIVTESAEQSIKDGNL